MRKPSKPRPFAVWVGYEDGTLYPWSTALRKSDCRMLLVDAGGDDGRYIPIRRATLTLTSGKPRKKNSGGPARPKGTSK